jgi:hypothetical protein
VEAIPLRRWRGQAIRELALEAILKPRWPRRREGARGGGPSPSELLPIRPEFVITELLRLRLEEPEEITPETGPHPLAGLQTAGILDRELGRIVIAGKFPPLPPIPRLP